MKNRWFRAKMYGWGWYPVSWQGWVLTLVYAMALIGKAWSIDAQAHSTSDFLINYGFYFILVSAPFLAICYLKGERPHFRWGK